MDGTELLHLLKKTTPKLIMIIITGYPSLENAIKAVNDGASGYVVKPISHEDVLAKMTTLIKKQQEDEECGESKVAEYLEARLKQFSMRPNP